MVQFVGPIPLPFTAARSIAAIGASATQTLFNGGLTGAQVDAARAAYWQSVATYRQTVLTAFQQVEDELAAIRIFTRQLAIDEQAVKNAREAVRVFTNQYRAGIVDLTTVVTAETNLLDRGGNRARRPAKSVSRQRQPDRGARRRLGHDAIADAGAIDERLLAVAETRIDAARGRSGARRYHAA